MLRRSFIFLILLGGFAIGCKKDKEEPLPPALEQKLSDVSYGSHSRQKMDVYLPAGRDEHTPVVLAIHGGSWIGGDKSDLTVFQNYLLTHKVASININYRFSSVNHHFEGLMEDVAAALSAVRNHAAEWQIKADQYVAVGISAGAHMALLYAYEYQKNAEISRVVSLSGPTDFRITPEMYPYIPLEMAGPLQVMVGAFMPLPPDYVLDPRFIQASPIAQMNKQVPTLLIHGTADQLVNYQLHAVALYEQLQLKGTESKLVTLDGLDHDLGLGDQQTFLTNFTRIAGEVMSWIK